MCLYVCMNVYIYMYIKECDNRRSTEAGDPKTGEKSLDPVPRRFNDHMTILFFTLFLHVGVFYYTKILFSKILSYF